MAGIKVLLVDDEKQFVDTMTKRLEKRGLAVTPAYDGQQALTALGEENCPEIVVLDVKMPGKDGFAVCEELRSRPATRDVPVLMMTGLNDHDSIVRAYEVGATDFAMKPPN